MIVNIYLVYKKYNLQKKLLYYIFHFAFNIIISNDVVQWTPAGRAPEDQARRKGDGGPGAES